MIQLIFKNKIKDKHGPMKIKFPIMGKVKLKNSNEKKTETNLENHKLSNSKKISSSQGKSVVNVNGENKSEKINGRNQSQKRNNRGVSGESISELEKERCLKPLMN
ncbi:hypothetical protein Anas_09774, partial [Armadillidium nasatum]